MKLGLFVPTLDGPLPLHRLAAEIEARGFESLWLPEVGTLTDSMDGSRASAAGVPHDPFVALAAAAAVTRTLRLATGSYGITEHDPIVLAKQVASLDQLSSGRFSFGIGGRWVDDPSFTWASLRERIQALRQIWQNETADDRGEFVRFGPTWSWPKPTQRPHPPVLLATDTPRGRQLVVDHCDGWIALRCEASALAEGLADLHLRATRSGRDLARIEISLLWSRAETDGIEQVCELGLHRVILALPMEPERERLLAGLDRYAALAQRLPV